MSYKAKKTATKSCLPCGAVKQSKSEPFPSDATSVASPKVTEEFIRFWLLRFRKLNMNQKDQRQALVDTFINSIYLYDDKVLITFNYKEGTQTVTFGEAAEAASKGNGSDLDCFTAPRTAA